MITLGQARRRGAVGQQGQWKSQQMHWWVCTHVKTDRKCVRAVGLLHLDSWCQQMPTAWAAFWEKISSRCLMKRLQSIRLSTEIVFPSDLTRFIPLRLNRISISAPIYVYTVIKQKQSMSLFSVLFPQVQNEELSTFCVRLVNIWCRQKKSIKLILKVLIFAGPLKPVDI